MVSFLATNTLNEVFPQKVCQNVDLCKLSMPCNNIFIMQLCNYLFYGYLLKALTYIQPE